MSAEHYRQQCKHGVMRLQCRCPGPKTLIIVPCGEQCADQPDYEPAVKYCDFHTTTQLEDGECPRCVDYREASIEADMRRYDN